MARTSSPRLGVGMEESLRHDIPALNAAFRAFNRWIDDDWGFAYKNAIFAAPYITLADPQWALDELNWAIGRGVRIIVMRTAPVPAPGGQTRSPGDPVYDPFWARAAEAGVMVAFHSGDAGYGKYIDDWEPGGDFEAFKFSALRTMTGDRAPVRHVRGARLPWSVHAPSRPALRQHRGRKRMGEAADQEVQEGVRTEPVHVRQRPDRAVPQAGVGGAVLRGRHSRRSPTRSAPTACCSAATTHMPKGWPSRRRSSTTCTASTTTKCARSCATTPTT